jgi:hypothetical protein
MQRAQVMSATLMLVALVMTGCTSKSGDEKPDDDESPPPIVAVELLTAAEWQLSGQVRSPRLRFKADGTVNGGFVCREVVFGRYDPTTPTRYQFTYAEPSARADCPNAASLRSALEETVRIQLSRGSLKLKDADGGRVGVLAQPVFD